MQHSVVMLMTVMLDGFVINRIPVRFKQIIGFLAFEMLSMVWVRIHAATGTRRADNSEEGPTIDDDADAMYPTPVNWNTRPITTASTVIGVIFVGSPLIFLFGWLLSIRGHRYLACSQSDELTLLKEDTETILSPVGTEDEEESSKSKIRDLI